MWISLLHALVILVLFQLSAIAKNSASNGKFTHPEIGIVGNSFEWTTCPIGAPNCSAQVAAKVDGAAALTRLDANSAVSNRWIRLHARGVGLQTGVPQPNSAERQSDGELSALINAVSRSKWRGMKVLVNLVSSDSDYLGGVATNSDYGYKKGTPHSALFKTLCGPGGIQKPSRIDWPSYSKRLSTIFGYLKSIEVNNHWTSPAVDAIEVGNELDWVCFNGDIPIDSKPTNAQYDQFVSVYATMVKTADAVAKYYFPNVKVVSFGFANPQASYLKSILGSSHNAHFDPKILLPKLANVFMGGNEHPGVDGIGLHFYQAPIGSNTFPQTPPEMGPMNAIASTLTQSSINKPLWITEWGYMLSEFAEPATSNRFLMMACFTQFISPWTCTNASSCISAATCSNQLGWPTQPLAYPVSTMLYYSYDDAWGLVTQSSPTTGAPIQVDSAGANLFKQYPY